MNVACIEQVLHLLRLAPALETLCIQFSCKCHAVGRDARQETFGHLVELTVKPSRLAAPRPYFWPVGDNLQLLLHALRNLRSLKLWNGYNDDLVKNCLEARVARLRRQNGSKRRSASLSQTDYGRSFHSLIRRAISSFFVAVTEQLCSGKLATLFEHFCTAVQTSAPWLSSFSLLFLSPGCVLPRRTPKRSVIRGLHSVFVNDRRQGASAD